MWEENILSALKRFFFKDVPNPGLGLLRIVLVGYHVLWRLPKEFNVQVQATQGLLGIMDPPFLLKLFPVPYPLSLSQLEVFEKWMSVFGWLATLGFLTRYSLFVFGLGMLYLGAAGSAWGHFNHATPLPYQTMLLMSFIPGTTAWSLDHLGKGISEKLRKGGESFLAILRGSSVSVWGVKLILILLSLSFFTAGVSKIRYSGLRWTDGQTLSFYLAGKSGFNVQQYTGPEKVKPERAWKDGWGLEGYLYGCSPSALAGKIAQNPLGMKILSIFTLGVELGMPLILLGGWFQTLFLISGFFLIKSIGWLMGIHFRTLALMCLFLIDWPWHYRQVREGIEKLRKKRVKSGKDRRPQ